MLASYKNIWRIAYPIIIGSAIQTLISVTDTAFMGRVGEVELGAIGFISVYYLILFMIGYSYTKGTQILVARRVGENKLLKAGEIFDHSLLLMISLALFLVGLITVMGKPTISLMLDQENVIAASLDYLQVRKWGLIASFTGSVFLAFYMAVGRTTILLIGITMMSMINIFLNYVLIFGHFGFAPMGIRGAALASDIAEAVATVFFTFNIIYSGSNKKYGLLLRRKLKSKTIKRIVKLSTPIVLQTILGLFSWMIFFSFVEKMGTKELAVSNVIKSIYMFVGIVTWGFASAANTVISNLMGQGKSKQVGIAIKRIMLLSLLLNAIICIVLAIFPRQVMSIISPDQNLITLGLPAMYVTIGAILVYSVSNILFHGIVSTGSTKVSLYIEIITVLSYLAYLQLLFHILHASLGLAWTSEIFYWSVTALMTLIYLRSGRWKGVEI